MMIDGDRCRDIHSGAHSLVSQHSKIELALKCTNYFISFMQMAVVIVMKIVHAKLYMVQVICRPTIFKWKLNLYKIYDKQQDGLTHRLGR